MKPTEGIDDNVDYSNGLSLESEITRAAHTLIKIQGGITLLEDVYCAVNRARGTQLVSPEEVLASSKNIEKKYPQGQSHHQVKTYLNYLLQVVCYLKLIRLE